MKHMIIIVKILLTLPVAFIKFWTLGLVSLSGEVYYTFLEPLYRWTWGRKRE